MSLESTGGNRIEVSPRPRIPEFFSDYHLSSDWGEKADRPRVGRGEKGIERVEAAAALGEASSEGLRFWAILKVFRNMKFDLNSWITATSQLLKTTYH